MKLVENARQCWRWISMQCMALALAVQGVWEVIPADMKATVEPQTVKTVTAVLLVAGIVGRLVKQEPKA